MISQWLTEYVLVPLKLVVLGRKRIPREGIFWRTVLAKTGQPIDMVNVLEPLGPKQAEKTTVAAEGFQHARPGPLMVDSPFPSERNLRPKNTALVRL